MKILGKNILIGTKKLCVEYTSKIQGSFDDCYVGSNEYKGKSLEENVIFIRDKKGYLVEITELGTMPTFSLICYGAARRWKTYPKNAGDYYVDEIKPYLPSYDQDTLYELKTLISAAKIYRTKEYQSTLDNSNSL